MKYLRGFIGLGPFFCFNYGVSPLYLHLQKLKNLVEVVRTRIENTGL